MNSQYNNLPKNFAHPGGFVENVMNFINETAVCPQPLFALGAALSLAGTLYGRRVQGEDGQRTNLFVMTVGYTSSGKDHALKSISRILDECAASHLRLGQVTSDSAIEWALKRQPRLCLLIDEAGHFFSGVSAEGTKGSPQHAIKPALLELWSSANGVWKGKQRVPKNDKPEPPLEVVYPHLCLYATTQPQIMFESLCRNDLRDGWLSRNLFFISETRPKPSFQKIVPIPNAIRGEVLAWKGEPGDTALSPQSPVPSPQSLITVPTTQEAQVIFSAFNDFIYAKMLQADKCGDEVNYLYGKALENARRVALTLAVSRAGERACVEPDDATYATSLVRYLIEAMLKVVNDNISDSVDEKNKKRIKLIIGRSGYTGITKKELTKRTQFIRKALRDEYLDDLLGSEEIVVKPIQEHGHGDMFFLKGLES